MLKPCLKCKIRKDPKKFHPKKKLYCLECEPYVPRASRGANSLVAVDFKKEYKRLLTILHREIARMMENSYQKCLSRDESSTLISYLKLVSELHAIRKFEEAEQQLMENRNESVQ